MTVSARVHGSVAAAHDLPPELADRIFTRGEALAAGLTPAMLRGSRVERVERGLFRYVGGGRDPLEPLRTAIRIAPHAAISHISSLELRGFSMGPCLPVHVATNRPHQVRRTPAVIVHRHQGELEREQFRGIPVLGAERTFVDCGTLFGLADLVAAGDWLVARRMSTVQSLRTYSERVHLDGVQRARVAAELIRERSESVRESIARFHLVARGLPEPDPNLEILDAHDGFVARGDVPFPQWKVLVEYDSWYHERDAVQRQYDILRRERLEAQGWLVIVLTSADVAHPDRMAWRVYNALCSRGYSGPTPRLDPRFARWMRSNSGNR